VRYVIALIVAAVLIAAGAAFVRLTFSAFEAQVRRALRAQQQAGTLPPELQGIDVESVNIWESNIRVPRGQEAQLQLAMLLSDMWFIWAPLVVAVCVGVAALVGRRGG